MKLLITFGLFLSASLGLAATSPGNLDCKAQERATNAAGQVVVNNAQMVAVLSPPVVKYSVQIGEKAFSVTEGIDSLLGQIISGPDFKSGFVVRGNVDLDGRFTLTEVNELTTYRIECKKK